MKHIGILAHSAEGSALCYLTACREGAKRLGAHMHPDVTVAVIAMGRSMDAWEAGELAPIAATLSDTAARLAAAGCDFFVCPDNTAHIALEAARDPLPLPGLHIADVVAGTAVEAGYKKIGVLGTKWTMDGPIYPAAFARVGLECVSPAGDDAAFVQHTILEELCNGVFTDDTRDDYGRIISRLADQGCDAVVLGCTEIPLLISPETSPLPTLDSTRLLATAAVEAALGERPEPSWRGGPVSA